MIEKRYENLDGVRAVCCLAIIVMHVEANTSYEAGGFIYHAIIPSWTAFVYLFLMLSAFSMCCGYYTKFVSKEIDLEAFYSRRYKKIVPFFALLLMAALAIDRSVESLYEAIIEVVLLHGLLPNNNLDVLGVSWTLGVIFVFYLLFPFFTYLLRNKKRAWFSFFVSLLITYLCEIYFFTDKFVVQEFANRHCFLYCAPFFMAGGLFYIYRQRIESMVNRHALVFLFFCAALSGLYYLIPDMIGAVNISVWKLMAIYGAWLCLLISRRTKLLDNKMMHFLGSISLEMYLAQMISFRVIEKLGLLYVFGRGWTGYIIASVMVIALLILLVVLAKWFLDFIEARVSDKTEK